MARQRPWLKGMATVAALAVAVMVVWVSPVSAAFTPTKSAIKKIAKKVAKKQIKKMASTLSVAHAASADKATLADEAVGVERFRVTLAFGQEVTILQHGMVSLVAQCRENISGDQDEIRLLAASTGDAFMQGDTPHSGPGGGASSDYLTPATVPDNRTMGGLVSLGPNPDLPVADDDIDTGFVMGTDGKAIHVDETTVYGIRVGPSACMMAGLAVLTG